jgi:exodeoxyribonuclease-1
MFYLFYDTETTGLDKTYEQILQFAAILTDNDLNEIDRLELRCRLQPHIIPAPGAMLATRVTPAMLVDPNLPTHYGAIRLISDQLRKWSPATFIGYNTLSYDEPLLRQAFYQTLQPVYLTNTGGNRRADVLRLAQATAVLAPDAMVVPISDKGKPTLKLDMLAPANGFAHENAHDALADVEATIFMARLIRDRAPAIWNALMPLTGKAEVISRALSEGPQCLIEYHMGRPAARAVVGCGQSPDNSSMLGVFDLSNDPETIFELEADDLAGAMTGSNRAIRIIYANRMPALTDLAMAPDIRETVGVPIAVIEDRARQITANVDFQRRVSKALALHYPPGEPSKIVEQRIYEGFPSRKDEERMRAFHQAGWAERAQIAETFEDDRFQELGRRLVFLEEPSALQPAVREQFEAWLHNRRNGREGVTAGRTLTDALDEVGKLAEEADENQIEAIETIRAWLTTLTT